MSISWTKKSNSRSPYLSDDFRLGNVVSAIQALALYKDYKCSPEDWADRISARKEDGPMWERIFGEHPEFFRFDTDRKQVSLIWRRQHPKRYDPKTGEVISRAQFYALSDPEKASISRSPLTSADVKALIDTAVNLHTRAIEHQKESRWWMALSGAFGGLGGALIGAWLKN